MVFCGIDVGTTNMKGIVLDERGEILSSISIANPDASDGVFWYENFEKAMDKFKSDGVFESQEIYCSITSQGGSFILLDESLKPASDMYIWTDMESGKEAAQSYEEKNGREGFYKLTGWGARGWLPVFKLKNISKESYSKVAFVPDFIYAQIAGELVTDVTNAQITGLYDYEKNCWSDELTDWAGVEKNSLPTVCDSLQVIFKGLGTKWGKLNIVTSTHDQYAAMNAVSLEVDKDIMLASGTAWVVNSRRSEAIYDKNGEMLHPGRDISGDNYGNISVVGSNLGKGFHDLLCSIGVGYDELESLEDEILALDVPEKEFEQTGYDVETEKVLLIRRYMEWMAAVVKSHFVKQGFMDGLKEIILTGGAANSRVLPQILANVCGVEVKTVVFPELTAYGAAKFAAESVGIGFAKTIEDISGSKTYLPANQKEYEQWYAIQVSKI